MKLTKKYIGFIFLLSAMLLVGCSGDDSPNADLTGDEKEIRLNAEVWQVMEGTRATTYDNQAGIQAEGSFTCTAYDAGTTTVNNTSNVENSVANWNSGTSKWEFAEIHKWPDSGSLDFFAYMPKATDLGTYAGYISSIAYEVSRQPVFVCANLPMTNAGQSGLKEFIYALTPGQSKAEQGASGVTMTFKHPFARVKFVLSSASGSNVKVNSITIHSLFTGATYTHNSGWAMWTGDESLEISGNPATGDTYYLVVPNNYGSKTFTVSATWDDWSNVTTNVTSSPLSINWEAGRSYTYTLTLSKYALKVDIDKYTEQW